MFACKILTAVPRTSARCNVQTNVRCLRFLLWHHSFGFADWQLERKLLAGPCKSLNYSAARPACQLQRKTMTINSLEKLLGVVSQNFERAYERAHKVWHGVAGFIHISPLYIFYIFLCSCAAWKR